jgi:hypothetical protein
MIRFEALLATRFDQQLSASEICASIEVSERTLRMCCAEFLNMSPSQYVRLRRLNSVRAAPKNKSFRRENDFSWICEVEQAKAAWDDLTFVDAISSSSAE